MATTPVVTAFLRNRDDVLLARRSEAVGSYSGRWGGVSGHVAADDEDPTAPTREPLAAARDEVAEETGLLDACELVRAGEPFLVEDRGARSASDGAGGDEPRAGELDRTWTVHPFLFDCASRDVEPNEEAVETAWVRPPEILRRETVPALWTSYDHVRPTVATVRADAEHGSAYVSVRALDVLRDRAGELAVHDADGTDGAEDDGADVTGDADETGDADDDAWTELAALAGELLDARPDMAALRTRVDRAMAGADERTAAAVETSADEAIDGALAADRAAAATAAGRIEGTVLTLSRSGTVLAALGRADPDGVVVAESRPAREGVGVAERLAADGHDVTLVTDAAVAHTLAGGAVDAVLVGADTVLPDGGVVNKVGTRAAALAAGREGVPLYAVAARDKISPDDEPRMETGDPAAVYDGAADLRVENPVFDVTPPDLVTAVLTDGGALSPADVAAVADRHRELGVWRRDADRGG